MHEHLVQCRVAEIMEIDSANEKAIQEKDVQSDLKYWEEVMAMLNTRVQEVRGKFQVYLEISNAKGLHPDDAGKRLFALNAEYVESEIKSANLALSPEKVGACEQAEIARMLTQKFRGILHGILQMSICLDWRAAPYAQSIQAAFFKERSLVTSGINYNRSEGERVEKLEMQLAEMLNLGDERGVLMTSSGMAAYNLIESYLLREVLKPGDTVYIPNAFYCEAIEQLEQLPHINLVQGGTFDMDEILCSIKSLRPRVVLMDVISNDRELRVNDVNQLIQKLSETNDAKIAFVIDGTLAPALRSVPQSSKTVEVLYFESGTKYLQLGVDITMSGYVVFSKASHGKLDQLRRTTGTILYDPNANGIPDVHPAMYAQRMRRMTRNAVYIAEVLMSDEILRDALCVRHPLQKNHPDFSTACAQGVHTSLVAISFLDEELNKKENVTNCVTELVDLCHVNGVIATKGESFGFAFPRVIANAESLKPDSRIYLRIEAGDRTLLEMKNFANLLVKTLKRTLAGKIIS